MKSLKIVRLSDGTHSSPSLAISSAFWLFLHCSGLKLRAVESFYQLLRRSQILCLASMRGVTAEVALLFGLVLLLEV